MESEEKELQGFRQRHSRTRRERILCERTEKSRQKKFINVKKDYCALVTKLKASGRGGDDEDLCSLPNLANFISSTTARLGTAYSHNIQQRMAAHVQIYQNVLREGELRCQRIQFWPNLLISKRQKCILGIDVESVQRRGPEDHFYAQTSGPKTLNAS